MWSPQVLNPNLNLLPFPTNGQFIRVAEVVGYIQHIVCITKISCNLHNLIV
jgi:hypothetical protein